MKEIVNKKLIFKYKERWFDNGMQSNSMARVFQSKLKNTGLILFKKQKTTIVINLDSWNRIKMRATTRNEIKKIEDKMMVHIFKKWIEVDTSYKKILLEKYNKFADNKKITKMNTFRLEAFGENCLISELVIEGSSSYHIYISDGSRCRLLYSWRETLKSADKIILAAINKLHTVIDIEKIKEYEMKTYDFGGWSEKKERGIDKFKTQFGGTITVEYNYFHIPSLKH